MLCNILLWLSVKIFQFQFFSGFELVHFFTLIRFFKFVKRGFFPSKKEQIIFRRLASVVTNINLPTYVLTCLQCIIKRIGFSPRKLFYPIFFCHFEVATSLGQIVPLFSSEILDLKLLLTIAILGLFNLPYVHYSLIYL